MHPTWLRRNFDLVAVAFIALFGIVGTITYRPYRMPVIVPSDPFVREVKPRLLEIHHEYESAALELRQELRAHTHELRGDLRRSAADLSEDSRSAAHGLGDDLREAAHSFRGEVHSLRDQLHCLRDTIRETVRSQKRIF